MDETEQILISWIDEYAYCPRRFYLKVLEKQEGSNIFMVQGTLEHKNVDNSRVEKRKDCISTYALEVHSETMNLYGKCDAVEFHVSPAGVFIPFLDKTCFIIPVEFKHGRIRNEKEYNLQLTAQALCLEEMYGCHIDKGYIYYVDSKSRYEVDFDDDIRDKVQNIILNINKLLMKPRLIEPKYKKRCRNCSVYDICNPRETIVSKYMNSLKERYYETSK
jgi:CRISPR-associated exonuclease Cas4